MIKVSMSTHFFEKVPNLPERLLKRVRKYRPEWPRRTSPIRGSVPPFLGALTSLLSPCYYSHLGHWSRLLVTNTSNKWQAACIGTEPYSSSYSRYMALTPTW